MAKVSTTEHLLAAFWCAGVSGADITLDEDEVPVLDGSAKPWLDLIEGAGKVRIRKADPFMLTRAVRVEGGDGSWAEARPSMNFSLSVRTEFSNPGIGISETTMPAHPRTWACAHIAAARTFIEESWIAPLRERGLAQGGSLENAVVLDAQGRVLNPEGLRAHDEPHRHKILDVLGDLALLSVDICANIHMHRPGHRLSSLLTQAMADAGCRDYDHMDRDDYRNPRMPSRKSTVPRCRNMAAAAATAPMASQDNHGLLPTRLSMSAP